MSKWNATAMDNNQEKCILPVLHSLQCNSQGTTSLVYSQKELANRKRDLLLQTQHFQLIITYYIRTKVYVQSCM